MSQASRARNRARRQERLGLIPRARSTPGGPELDPGVVEALQQRLLTAAQILVDEDLVHYTFADVRNLLTLGSVAEFLDHNHTIEDVEATLDRIERMAKNTDLARSRGHTSLAKFARGKPNIIKLINNLLHEARDTMILLRAEVTDRQIEDAIRGPDLHQGSPESAIRQVLWAIDRVNAQARKEKVDQ